MPEPRAAIARVLRSTLAGLIVAATPVAAIAEDARATKPLPPRHSKSNPCAAYGPGFAMAEGTSTCVRIGGSVGTGARSR
jgi:hypothetical protein